ncbi:MAG: helix-turn-helix domain-containing protein [Lachnospiraceae bacterium]
MSVDILMQALDYIEEHISKKIMVQDVADSCFISLSGLQKTFKYVFHISIHEYIIRRRFSCAARELLTTDQSILDISLKYGYSTAESFTRGFQKVWNITPSEFRRTRKFSGHTPKLALPEQNFLKEEPFMSGIKYDLTDLYDVLKERKNNAYVCADLCQLLWINENLGRQAGDAALLELMRRVEDACDPEDILLRIGGDEFVVFTNSADMEHANAIVRRVSEKNGNMVKCEDLEFPVSVHIGAFRNEGRQHVNAAEMFAEIADGIKDIHS